MLENPRDNLSQICETLNLDWTERMLNWTAGKKNYDGPWWPYWYGNVHKSDGFGPAKSMPNRLKAEHEKLVASTYRRTKNFTNADSNFSSDVTTIRSKK